MGEIVGWIVASLFGLFFAAMLFIALFDPAPKESRPPRYLHDVNSTPPQEEVKDATSRS